MVAGALSKNPFAAGASAAATCQRPDVVTDEVSGLDGAKAIAASWDAFPSPQGLAPLFLSSAWYQAFTSVFGSQADIVLMTFSAGERLVGIFPMMTCFSWRGPGLSVQNDPLPGDAVFQQVAPKARILPMRLMTPLLSVESAGFRGGFRCAPEERIACKRAILEHQTGKRGWDIAVLAFPASEFEEWKDALYASHVNGFFRETAGRRFHCRMQMLPAEEFLAGKSRNFRKAYRAAIRTADELGLRQRCFSGASEMAAGLDALEQAAASSWKHAGRADAKLVVPYTKRTRAFHEALIENAGDSVTPVVFTYFQGETCKAAALTFSHRGVLSGSHTYYSPDIAKADPGKYVMLSCIEWASANNLEWIDFNATADYIANYTDAVENWYELVVPATSTWGRICGALVRRFSRTFVDLPAGEAALKEMRDDSLAG
jgi:CelD/BcsL family acetyltransferase involved in cellulose biosynthesis